MGLLVGLSLLIGVFEKKKQRLGAVAPQVKSLRRQK